ncbi:hypothetical protein HMPREF0185_03462 [Brevundimonas diminuta 470-4]|nr:hypothetical protein HMPREF0185_03462 [Brevundimonas diminuta 470-4]
MRFQHAAPSPEEGENPQGPSLRVICAKRLGHDLISRYVSGFDLLVVADHEDLPMARSGSTRPTGTMPG